DAASARSRASQRLRHCGAAQAPVNERCDPAPHPMVPPIWLDEHGRRRAVRACPRCGREAPVYRFRLDVLPRVGWRLFAPAEYVTGCGPRQEFVPPDLEGASAGEL